MNATQPTHAMQRWGWAQREMFVMSDQAEESLTPKLIKVIYTLEWVRVEDFVESSWRGIGRRPHDRQALARAFVAKTVLGIGTTVGLIERLMVDRSLRRICGFQMWKKLPDEATFSRAFDEFARSKMAERAHEAIVKAHLGDVLVGHISRDGTSIEAREKPWRPTKPAVAETAEVAAPAAVAEQTPSTEPVAVTETAPATEPLAPPKAKRGRPRKDELRASPAVSRIVQQKTETLDQMLAALPKVCDRGTKCNSQGYKHSWNGYKLHIDTADCGVPISVLLTSASVHDSQTALPLALMSAERVTNCYDLMDAAYCSEEIRAFSRSLGHVPLIDHNPRRGKKIEFAPHEAQRYKERSQAERANARLKDEFGGRHVRVRGPAKVMSHLMLGILALTADQLMRLLL